MTRTMVARMSTMMDGEDSTSAPQPPAAGIARDKREARALKTTRARDATRCERASVATSGAVGAAAADAEIMTADSSTERSTRGGGLERAVAPITAGGVSRAQPLGHTTGITAGTTCTCMLDWYVCNTCACSV